MSRFGLVCIGLISLTIVGCPGDSGLGDTGGGVDTGGRDTPGAIDAPGSDVPGTMDTPGADVPGADVPGADVPGLDAPPPPMDVPGGTACGPSICAPGETCCNEACGFCVPPDGSCPADCRDGGTGMTCGGITGALCGRGEYCDIDDTSSFCGAAGVCRVRPSGCPRIIDPVCGCDGMDYSNGCLANAAGTDWVMRGMCGSTMTCDPDEARGVGACDLVLGYAWNGMRCVALSGCTCEGADCPSLPPDLDSCVAAHASCGSSGGFACGPDLFCETGNEYCQAFSGGPIGVIRFTCEPLPRDLTCRRLLTCDACFPPPSVGTCSAAGRGELTVRILAP